MTPQSRRRTAAAIFGIPFACFPIYLWLFYFYFGTRPKNPHPELGLVHSLNNHGTYVFISDTESTGLALLMYMCFAAIALFILVVPKEFILPAPGTPRWITKISGSFKTGLEHPSKELYFIMLGSVAISAAFIWAAGSPIVDYIVTHGVVLHF